MKEETTYGHQELINQVIDYIHTHLHKALTLEMLAAEMHMSVYHFHRLFKSHLQETLSAYITRQRMERAVMYLQTRDLSLQELSEKMGYDTAQSFSKAFKRYFGVSPVAFGNTLTFNTPETTPIEDIAFTGLDEPVIRFLEEDGEILRFLDHVYALVDASVKRYMERGFSNLSVCFGCTGGQHRSVYSAQHLAEHLNKKFGVKVELVHREQNIERTFEATI